MANKQNLGGKKDPEPKHLTKSQKRSALIRKIIIIISVICILFGVIMMALTIPKGN